MRGERSLLSFRSPGVLTCTAALLFVWCTGLNGQELPPRPITVTVNMSQNLAFGAFSHGVGGGTVIIYSDGSRSSTGDVVLLNLGYSFSTGLFDIVGNTGTVISVMNGPDISLAGSNGGTLTLHLGSTLPTSPFILVNAPPAVNTISIGGTLTVGNALANPPGNYSGTFEVTFIQE